MYDDDPFRCGKEYSFATFWADSKSWFNQQIGKGGFGSAGGFNFKDFQRRRPGGFKHKSAADTFKEFFGDEDPFANFDKFFEAAGCHYLLSAVRTEGLTLVFGSIYLHPSATGLGVAR